MRFSVGEVMDCQSARGQDLGFAIGVVQRTRESLALANALCASGPLNFEAISWSLKEERGMSRELELIAVSLVFVFLGAIVVGVIR